MKESIITGMLAVCSLVMAAAAGVGIFMTDRSAPVISLEGKNNLTYAEGEPYDVLLENMTAVDDKDGDVTDSLRVSSIYTTADNKAIVVYVAKDQANNIGKLKREIRYQAKEEADAAKEEPEDETSGEQTEENQPLDNDTPEEQTTEPETENEPLDGPRITMLQNEATLKVGETFNILRYVQSAVDRDGSSLSRSLHAEGAYDMSQPGVYEIRVYATNGNGETSNIETFTLTVEE